MLGVESLANDFISARASLEKAMAAEVRTDKDRARDRNRKPIETLRFFGLREDSRVIELLPGNGWYTKLLAPMLRDNGKLYLAIGADRALSHLVQVDGFDRISIIAPEASLSRSEVPGVFDLNLDGFGVTNVDFVLTFRNYHNFSSAGRKAINEASFQALRSGGIYAVVDHTRRHMESSNSENIRRFDPVLAIKEIQSVGFIFEDFATLHSRPDDELRYEVGRKSVTGNTDRWTLKFRKP
tara:strand:+ start:412 stop:1131 length:720 start_codon:yes stop_codon:yes gene_type:complete